MSAARHRSILESRLMTLAVIGRPGSLTSDMDEVRFQVETGALAPGSHVVAFGSLWLTLGATSW
jgi:hypothetical protein